MGNNIRSDPCFHCYQIDPIEDARWTEFVKRHRKASIFHTVSWLQALRVTYGYEPVVFTTSPPGSELKNGLVFCRINSWLTGRRLVSLPFSDHCELLCDSTDELDFLIRYLQAALGHHRWKYVQLRPISGDLGNLSDDVGFLRGEKYLLHILDLRPDLEKVFGTLDKDSVQRRIHHADRVGLVEKFGRSEDLLRNFYKLFVITRDRQKLPPTPFAWFRNLIQSQGQALTIRVAHKDATPVAAILTLRFRDVLYYKYGCSDARFNKFGATPWLLWKAVSEAKLSGANEFDMGRTEEGNAGLLAFKRNWVLIPKQLVYWSFPEVSGVGSVDGWKVKMAKRFVSLMPRELLAFTGRLIYRHIG